MPLQPDYKIAKKTRRRKETPTIHFKIIGSYDFLNALGYFLSYELVERLEVGVSNKERIQAEERLVF